MGDARAGQQKVGDDAARLLRGTIDIHVHTAPDSANRALDGIEASKMALAKGMRGLVLKNHLDPTAGLAYLARKQAPGVEVFGGVDLNLPVGGMNPFAVEHMTQVSGGFGRMVWMSTNDAENVVLGLEKSKRPFVSVARNGALLPETKAVIAMIAKHGLVLATGHTGAEEALLLLREGKAQGVAHMVVTHPLSTSPNMSIAQMQESAKLGAFLEIAGVQVVEATAADPAGMMNRIVDMIHKVGPEHIVLSSDLGQKGNVLPVDGYGAFLAGLLGKGITEQEIGLMSRQNPASLLGLPPGAH
jgi:hypothetical protein